VDPDKQDLLDDLKEEGTVRAEVDTLSELTRTEEVYYQQAYDKYTRVAYSDRRKWRACLGKNTLFKEPELINLREICRKKEKFNPKRLRLQPSHCRAYASATESEATSDFSEDGEYFHDHDDFKAIDDHLRAGRTVVTASNYRTVRNQSYSQVYVAPIVSKPGKRFYVVKAEMMRDIRPRDETDPRLGDAVNEDYFFHQMLVDPRAEEIPAYSKKMLRGKHVEEGFSKKDSLFAAWREPTAATYAKLLDYDASQWKIHRFEKDKEEEELIEAAFRAKSEQLFNVYIELASRSNFPKIMCLDFTDYCRSMDPECEMSAGYIDTIFPACMSDIKGDGSSSMYRYHFYEGLVRFAIAKYKHTGKCSTSSQAVRMLLDTDRFR
jgi:hypothetical protein